MAVTQYARGNQTLAYGIGDAAATVTVGGFKVYLQSAGVSSEGDLKTYKDNVGETCAIVIPEQWQVLNLDGILIKGSGGSMPKKGDEVSGLPAIQGLTTSGFKFRVETMSVAWANEDVAKVSMSVRGYKF